MPLNRPFGDRGRLPRASPPCPVQHPPSPDPPGLFGVRRTPWSSRHPALSRDPSQEVAMSRRSRRNDSIPPPARPTRHRLTREGELPDQAERLVAQSELQTAEDGLQRDGRFWDAAWSWMLAQRALLSSQATSEVGTTKCRQRGDFVRGSWWAVRDSNPRPPRCKRGALTS